MTIELNNQLLQQLNKEANTSNQSAETIIVEALKRYLHLNEIGRLRIELKDKAKLSGFESEQDFFDKIS